MGVARVAKSGRKRARHETIIGPAIDKDVAHEAVGVKPATLVPKEIPVIKKKNPVLQVVSFLVIGCRMKLAFCISYLERGSYACAGY